MQYAPEYVTALMVVSTAFLAVSGVILAIFASKDDDKRTNREELAIYFSAFSVIAGLVSMIYAMNWFGNPTDSGLNAARSFLLAQFVLLYPPLLWLGIRMFFRRNKSKKEASK